MINPFEKISNYSKEKLLKCLKVYTVNYDKNKEILENIREDNEIGIIIEGYVQIVRNNYNGTKTIIEELMENDLLIPSVIYVRNDEYQIITKEKTKIILFNYNDLINYEVNDKTYNQFIKNLFLITNNKIKEKDERIEILTNKTIRDKLLEYFNINSKKSGSKYIYLPFNFSVLADYLGVDRSAMSREIGYLKKEGFIEIKGKRITLLYR